MVFLFTDYPLPHWLKNILIFVLATAIIWKIWKDFQH
jgi:hypothetical protein